MPPSGMLIIPGVRAEMTFCKGLLDKLGLQFDALQMGKYKGAAEPFTRSEMSKPLRESLEALVDDTYQDLVATIVADRHMKDYKAKTLLDQGLFTAAAAQKAGLVDEVLYADQLQDAIRKDLKAERRGSQGQLQEEAHRHRLLRHLGNDEAVGPVDGREGARRRRASARRSPWSTPWGPSWKARAAATCSAPRPSARPHWLQPCRRRPTTPKWRPSCCGSTAPADRPRPAT